MPDELGGLIEELKTHQAHLELQNEAMREAYLELELSRRKYCELFELAPVAYLSLDDRAVITGVNRAARALFGMRQEQLEGQCFTSFVASEHLERFGSHSQQILDSATRCSCELVIEDARRRRHQVRIESVRVCAGASEWLMTVVDLTEMHELQHQLEEARRREVLGTLASGVAHDFNNLLMSVVGCADMAMDRLDAESDARALVTTIRDSALQGRSVVSQLVSSACHERPAPKIGTVDAAMGGERTDRLARSYVAPASQGPHVMVVEDERLVRFAMVHYLRSAGYTVSDFASGEAAVEWITDQTVAPHVIVTDVELPGIKGPEVAALARERWPEIGVVLCSSHAPALLAERGLIEPSARVMAKPFAPDELRTTVARAVAAHAAPLLREVHTGIYASSEGAAGLFDAAQ